MIMLIFLGTKISWLEKRGINTLTLELEIGFGYTFSASLQKIQGYGRGFPGGVLVKNSSANAGNLDPGIHSMPVHRKYRYMETC